MKRIVVLACAMVACGLSSPLAAEQAALPLAQAEQLPPPPPMPPMPSANPSHRWVDIDGQRSRRARSKASPARHASSVKQGSKARASTESASHKPSKSGKTKTIKASKSGKTKTIKASKSGKATKSVKASKSAKTSKSSMKAKRSNAGERHTTIATHRPDRKEKVTHFSAKTIRSCHAMTYSQIMRSSSCRAMIKQELAGSVPKERTSHKTSAHHKASSRSKTKSHSRTKRRRR